MDLRDLRAFVAVAEELHFARAAERLYVKPSTLSEQIRRLESELSTPLFTRTTRRVELTAAGDLLLEEARRILALTEAAEESVAAFASGTSGTLNVGLTPPAAPTLMPHITAEVARQAPGLRIETHTMWLHDLAAALLAGEVDLALTCHHIEDAADRVTPVEVAAEQLLVGLRNDHPLARRETADLASLEPLTMGIHRRRLFPAWHLAQLVALDEAGVSPRRIEFRDAEVIASGWSDQPEIDWILLIGSFGRPNASTTVLPVHPARYIPFTISWLTYRSKLPSITRFVDVVMRDGRPEGWQPPRSTRGTRTSA